VPSLDDLGEALAPLLGGFLPRQRWYAGSEPPADVEVTVVDSREGDPLLVWLLVDAIDAEGGRAMYQIVVGGRPVPSDAEFLQGKARVTLGEVDSWIYYDALVDPDLALLVLEKVAPDESADVARPLVVEQSNTSVVYDERLILKLFRRVHPEPNPDVEITKLLGERGFPHVVPQLAELRLEAGRLAQQWPERPGAEGAKSREDSYLSRDDAASPHASFEGSDLAVVRQYLLGSTDAWELAHTSLRDLLNTRVPPDEAGGDFGPEALTLGDVTGRLHLAMADVFGTEAGSSEEWLAGFRAQLERLPDVAAAAGTPVAEVVDAGAVEAALAALADVSDAGKATRIHGDLHLAQMLLADAGWFVLDFEGEPVRPVAERVRASSPLRDVAGMVRSFHYAARTGLAERGRDVDPELVDLAVQWESRARDEFWRGYQSVAGIDRLLPASTADRESLLRAFELDKAVYEIIYELSHRPDWVDIPASAVRRTLALVA
jgi:maltokinase